MRTAAKLGAGLAKMVGGGELDARLLAAAEAGLPAGVADALKAGAYPDVTGKVGRVGGQGGGGKEREWGRRGEERKWGRGGEERKGSGGGRRRRGHLCVTPCSCHYMTECASHDPTPGTPWTI